MNFSKKQCDELKQTYELQIIRKIKLGDNFPRKLSYVRKSALGVGLIEPKIAIDYLAIKLYEGNKRSKGELETVISTHEETCLVDSGLQKKVRRNEIKLRHWKE